MLDKPTPEQKPQCEYAGKYCYPGSILKECLVNLSRISCEHFANTEIYPECFMAKAHKRYLQEIANLSIHKE